MWFINEALQMVGDSGSPQEKRARHAVTRPEPTIYGNCDSWDFIVGKLAPPDSPENRTPAPLHPRNKKFIHSLSTI
jgi:hypothetical protein